MQMSGINSLKTVVNFLLLCTVLTSSCAQSSKNTNIESDRSTQVEAVVDKPAINFQMAVLSGDLEAVKQHIAAGSDINEIDQMSGSTPLISAASFGKTEIVSALIEANADLSLRNNEGATALHTAAFFCHVEVVQLLIDANADRSAKNNFGATPRESVMGSFAAVKPIYEMLQQQLGPLGMELDLDEIEKMRPVIAMMLQ